MHRLNISNIAIKIRKVPAANKTLNTTLFLIKWRTTRVASATESSTDSSSSDRARRASDPFC